MKAKELREKSVEELNSELLNLLREQFSSSVFSSSTLFSRSSFAFITSPS